MEPPYQGLDRRSTPPVIDPTRITQIEMRQSAIVKDIQGMKTELSENTVVTRRVAEILEAPATFWAWCAKWGRRVSIFAKFCAPIIGLGVVLNQFLHIDLWDTFVRWWHK